MEAVCKDLSTLAAHTSHIRVQDGDEADTLRSLETEIVAKALSKTRRNESRALCKGMEVQWAGLHTHAGKSVMVPP